MAKSTPTQEVVFVQVTCPRYRIPFFSGLRESLRAQGLTLRLLYGESQSYAADFPGYFGRLAWAEPFKPVVFPVRSATLEPVIWHPVVRRVLGADLVITEAAARYLETYLLFAIRRLGGPRLAFWGHGWNHFLDDRDSLSERVKHWLGRRADWYFAYTSEVERGLVERGYDPARITDVQNAVESPPADAVTPAAAAAVRKDWNIGPDDPVALYCGRLYQSKRLDFLIDAADRVHRDLPSFHLIVAGSGPLEPFVRDAARQRSYIHFAGPLFGARKHQAFAISRLLALPGRVGLGVVDAFHYNVPPVATRYPYHSPEFAYLRHEENGLISADDVASYTAAMLRLAGDDGLHAKLVSGCRESARAITMDEMIARFSKGIIAALGMTPKDG